MPIIKTGFSQGYGLGNRQSQHFHDQCHIIIGHLR